MESVVVWKGELKKKKKKMASFAYSRVMIGRANFGYLPVTKYEPLYVCRVVEESPIFPT